MTKLIKEVRKNHPLASANVGPQAGEDVRDDEQLFERYRASCDQAVFAALVARYERELYNYLRRYLGDATLAEDVFQSTFLQVHVNRQAFESGRKFRPWLYTIATNQAIDAQRRNRRHRRLSLDQPQFAGSENLGTLVELVADGGRSPGEAFEAAEQGAWVRNEVEALPEPLQNAVKLVYFGGMKYGDAAKVMSVPVGTVKSRLHSAIRQLGQAWRNLQPGQPV